ncbi:transcriptional regulator, partial [Rhodococcus sp. ACPA1]
PLPADPGLVLTLYSVEPGSPSADAMTLLANWAATNLAATAAADQPTHSTSE